MLCIQANEQDQWETLAEILMDACTANPASSHQLQEALTDAVTPSGNGWGIFGHVKSAVGGMASLFRHQQGRDRQPVSHAVDSDQSDQDEFQIGTTPVDSSQHQHKAADADAPEHAKSVALAQSVLPAPAEAE